MALEVGPSGVADRAELGDFLTRWHSLRVARRGELVDALDHPAFLARVDGELVGVATYVVRDDATELLTLHTDRPQAGIGTALVDAVRDAARGAGCVRLWVVTTNDNIDALRFYQRRGFRLAELRAGAVDRSRADLKPDISELGDHGIPLRDEIELEMALRGRPHSAGGQTVS